MIRKIILTAVVAITFFLSAAAQQTTLEFALDNLEHAMDVKRFVAGNIKVELLCDESNAELVVEVENTEQSQSLIMFDQAYKRKNVMVKMAKNLGEAVEGCPYVNSCPKLGPNAKFRLEHISVCCDTTVNCILPIYVAKEKKNFLGRKMTVLEERIDVGLSLQVKLHRYEFDGEKWTAMCNELLSRIKADTYCKGKYHQGTKAAVLKKKYQDEIGDLQREMKAAYDSLYVPNAKAKEVYGKLKTELDAVVFPKEVSKCSQCVKKISDSDQNIPCCKYSRNSNEAVKQSLSAYFQNLRGGTVKKTQILSEVEALYLHYKKHNRGNDSKIEEYYNYIKR